MNRRAMPETRRRDASHQITKGGTRSFAKRAATLFRESEQLHGRIIFTTLVIMPCSAWMTAMGIMNMGIEAGTATTEGSVTAVMTALAASTTLTVAITGLFNTALNAGRRQKRHIVGLAAVLSVFTAGISTTFSIIGNAGAPSIVYNMRDAAPQWSAYFERSVADAGLAKSARATISPAQEIVCGFAEEERTRGIFSGRRGVGQASVALEGGCTGLRRINETLAETAASAEDMRERGAALLQELQDIPKDSSVHVFERQNRFRKVTSELEAIIADAATENVAKRLNAQLAMIKNSVITGGADENDAFAQKQAQAAEHLRGALAVAEREIGRLLAQTETAKAQPPEALLSSGAAVMRYAKRNAPLIFLAVMLDFISLYFLWLLLVSRKSAENVAYAEALPSSHTSRS